MNYDDGFNPLGSGPDPEVRLRPAPDTREALFDQIERDKESFARLPEWRRTARLEEMGDGQ